MGKTYATPEMTVYGPQSADSATVFTHGFGGGRKDPEHLGVAIGEYGVALIGYNRLRGRSLGDMVPPRREGTGALQVSAVGLLDAASVVARDPRYTSVDFIGHSYGCAAVVSAFKIVEEGNLPPFLKSRQKDLEDIMLQAHKDLVAPAGLTEMAILAPTDEFCLHSLAWAMLSGGLSIARDTDLSLNGLMSQLPRLADAASYIVGDPLFTLAEGLDLGNIRTLQGVADMYIENPGHLGIIAYPDDEIVPHDAIVSMLQNPQFKGLDKALRVIGKESNPVRILELISSGRISALTPARVAKFIVDSLSGYGASIEGDDALALHRLSEKVIRLKGGHSELLTKKGATPLAEAIIARRSKYQFAPAA